MPIPCRILAGLFYFALLAWTQSTSATAQPQPPVPVRLPGEADVVPAAPVRDDRTWEMPIVVIPPKISPEVLEAAKTQGVLPLFIVLKNQPQTEIMTRLHATHAVRLETAERRYRDAVAMSRLTKETLEAVHKDVDETVLAIRRQAAEEIRILGPAQQ